MLHPLHATDQHLQNHLCLGKHINLKMWVYNVTFFQHQLRRALTAFNYSFSCLNLKENDSRELVVSQLAREGYLAALQKAHLLPWCKLRMEQTKLPREGRHKTRQLTQAKHTFLFHLGYRDT